MTWGSWKFAIAAAVLLAPAIGAQPAADDLSVEEILRTQITSVGRKAQQVAKAAAAVYVITQEDIRRSGATNIPDLLRIVPGMVVARINGSTWAISARGDARQYSNKMLVLIDGRSVYGRLFSGVYWNAQDLLLEDIDRIEVIRGPGAVMWGSNAVNGLISIITKNSKATQGGLVSLGLGTDDRAMVGFRYGGRRGDRLTYRFWGKFNAREYRDAGTSIYRPGVAYGVGPASLVREVGAADDQGQLWRTGFRMDWERSPRDLITVSGELYGQRYLQNTWAVSPTGMAVPLPTRDKPAGGNILARWTRSTSANEDTTIQFWADHATQNGALYKLTANVADAEMQHRRILSENNELHIGGGYRLTSDSLKSAPFKFRPGTGSGALLNAVVRDEQQLLTRKLILSVALRVEHNGYTGFEYQPSVRLMHTPIKEVSWWLAWSRAVRTPSRVEADAEGAPIGNTFYQQLPVLLQLFGSRDVVSERVAATEAGFRVHHRQRWSIDLAAFYNRQSRLSSVELGDFQLLFQPVLDIRQNTYFANLRRGTGCGGEAALSAVVRPWWRMQGSYSFLQNVADADPGSKGLTGRSAASDPAHQAKMQSFWNFGRRWQADVTLYAVGRVAEREIPGYLRADTRLSWRPGRNQEWSFVAQDLFNHYRLEWAPELYAYGIPARRAILLRWTLQF